MGDRSSNKKHEGIVAEGGTQRGGARREKGFEVVRKERT